eukprot:gene26011-11707_t
MQQEAPVEQVEGEAGDKNVVETSPGPGPSLSESPSVKLRAAARAAAGEQIGVQLTNKRLMKLVDDMLTPDSLPKHWSARFDEDSSKWLYAQDGSGVIHYEHPLIDYYKGALFMDRGGYKKLIKAKEENPPAEEEIAEMTMKLGIKEDEDMYIHEVAELRVVSPHHKDWVPEPQPEGSNTKSFRNLKTGVTIKGHPMDPYFQELLVRRRNELARRRWAAGKALQAALRLAKGMKKREEPIVEDREDPLVAMLMEEWKAVYGAARSLGLTLEAIPPPPEDIGDDSPDAAGISSPKLAFPRAAASPLSCMGGRPELTILPMAQPWQLRGSV